MKTGNARSPNLPKNRKYWSPQRERRTALNYQAAVRAAAQKNHVEYCRCPRAAPLPPEPECFQGKSLSLGGLLRVDGGLLAHGSEDNDVYCMVSCVYIVVTLGNSLVSLPSSLNILLILSPTSPSGFLTSSLVLPSSDMRERKPSSVTSTWYLSAVVGYKVPWH